MNRKEAYELGIKTLTDAGIEEAKSDTLLLMDTICHVSRSDMLVHGEMEVEESQVLAFKDALQKRQPLYLYRAWARRGRNHHRFRVPDLWARVYHPRNEYNPRGYRYRL